MSGTGGKQHFTWRKLSAAKWEDVWPERLSEFADRLAITAIAGRKSIRVEVFQITRKQAQSLVHAFGGEAAPQRREVALQPQPRKPIRIRGKLSIVSSEREQAAAAAAGERAILIPAGMAFGTGDHATTATCLRLLADIAAEQTEPWEMLDLGCGTGILAIAARVLGAAKTEAGDFDPDAVRVTKENVRANGLRGIRTLRLDVREWTPERTWKVVAANLFSGLLIETAPKIAAATEVGGRLVFSGVLREQESGVVQAFENAGFRIDELVRKGKWVAAAATRLAAGGAKARGQKTR